MKLLGAGIPVLGEKPISNRIPEARRMVALGVDTNIPARLPQRLPDRIPWTRRERISGRPALTDQGIVFTDATGLRLVDYELTTVRDLTTEPFRESDHGTYSGNVVVSDDRILVMSRDLLTSFVPRRAVAPAKEKGGPLPRRKKVARCRRAAPRIFEWSLSRTRPRSLNTPGLLARSASC